MLRWEVYYFNCNKQKIEVYNCLASFEEVIKRLKKTCRTKNEFAEKVRFEMQYRFWSRAEYELIITTRDDRVFLLPWCGCRDTEACKLDITELGLHGDSIAFAKKMLLTKNWGDRAKIDIYDQIMFYFEDFIEYLLTYKFKYERKKVWENS